MYVSTKEPKPGDSDFWTWAKSKLPKDPVSKPEPK